MKNNQKLKVLFITRKWPPAVGGMETYSIELAAELKKRSEVSVFSLPGRNDGNPPSKVSLVVFFMSSMLRCFKRQNVDVIHLGDMVLWPLSLATRILNRDARLIISAHGTDIAYPLRSGLSPWIYGLYLNFGAYMTRNILTVIANSKATAEHCMQRGFKRTHVVPLGVRQDNNVSIENKNTQEEYILFVGRLAKRKGAAWFIDNVLPDLPKELKFKIAGTKWDDEEWKIVTAASPRVEFMGAVYGQELAKLRRNALVVVMPNLTCGGKDFEGFGLTALEAAADGGILLASGIDGIVDAVIDGKTGWLLPSIEPCRWIKKIEEITEWDAAERKNFTIQAQDAVSRYYSWGRVAQDTIDVYKSTVV